MTSANSPVVKRWSKRVLVAMSVLVVGLIVGILMVPPPPAETQSVVVVKKEDSAQRAIEAEAARYSGLAEFYLADSAGKCKYECPADLNGDGVVDALDLAIVLGAWGPNPGHIADLNGDGMVNATDLAFVLGAWGPCWSPRIGSSSYSGCDREEQWCEQDDVVALTVDGATLRAGSGNRAVRCAVTGVPAPHVRQQAKTLVGVARRLGPPALYRELPDTDALLHPGRQAETETHRAARQPAKRSDPPKGTHPPGPSPGELGR